MKFRAVNFRARFGGLATVLLSLSAAAQQTVQFTKPVDSGASGPANSFMPGRNAATAYSAPLPAFGSAPASANFDILPGAVRPNLSSAQAAQWQKILEDRKNWTLMTPEQILEIPTPEQILGVINPNDDPKMSPEEKFLRRRDQEVAEALTNHLARPDSTPWFNHNPEGSVFDPVNNNNRYNNYNNSGYPGVQGNSTVNPAMKLKAMFASTPNSLADQNQQSDSPWVSPFAPVTEIPQQTPEQLAGMERFRALMEPQVPEKTASPATTSYQHTPAPDPFFQAQPAFNPAGATATPIRDDIIRPTGLTPLTGVAPTTPKKAPLVQPPPWLQPTLQNPIMPQRQF